MEVFFNSNSVFI